MDGTGRRRIQAAHGPCEGGCRRLPTHRPAPPPLPNPAAPRHKRGSRARAIRPHHRLETCTFIPLSSAPLACTFTACTLHTPIHTNTQVISRSKVTMTDAVSVTGETLSFSPSTNPTLTDDSVTIAGKHMSAVEGVAGGNAAAPPAASCPIDDRSGGRKSPRPSSKRPASFPS